MGAEPDSLIRVDRGIPLPETRNVGRKGKYPWRQMQPGDSFFVANAPTNRLGACARSFRRTRPNTDFTARKVVENGVQGVRVWRIR